MKEDKIFRRNPDIVSRVIDDETILLPVYKTSDEAEAIYNLNKSAKFVWDLIDGKRTIGEIKKMVGGKFDTIAEEADKEIASLLKDLEKIKAIR